jgi:predicted RNase H-like nuclease (RuvC/YqgF family)
MSATEGDTGGASSSIPSPTPEDPEVILGRRLQSGAEPEAAPTPLPRVLSRAHQALWEIEAAILWEWEALATKHQHLGDWRAQLEERTKAASHQFASERSELEQEREDYKEDLQKVFDREREVTQKEKRLAKIEEHLDQREEVITML